MKIYILGNPLVKDDNIALATAKHLKHLAIEFVEFDPLEDIEDDAIFMDAVKGLKDVKIIDENCIQRHKIYSLHDFDLSVLLPLLKKIGKIKKFKIIGIPPKMKPEEAAKKVEKIIKSLST